MPADLWHTHSVWGRRGLGFNAGLDEADTPDLNWRFKGRPGRDMIGAPPVSVDRFGFPWTQQLSAGGIPSWPDLALL